MLGPVRLVTFALRALVIVVILAILWPTVAEPYNQGLVHLAGPLIPDLSVKALGSHLLFQGPELASSVSIDGLTLHFGLVLMAVLVLAAVGLGVLPRLFWLAVLGSGAFLLHVVGVALLGRGILWASSPGSAESSGELVFSLFAVFWGLLPAAIGGAWCFMYWLPRVADGENKAPVEPPLSQGF